MSRIINMVVRRCSKRAASTSNGRRLDPFVLRTPPTMSFGIYLGGILLVIGGLIYAATMLHAPIPWIVAGALVMLGLGILAAVKATRQRDAAR